MLIYEKIIENLPTYLLDGKRSEMTVSEIESYFEAVPIVIIPDDITNKEAQKFEGVLDLPFKSCFFELLGSKPINNIQEGKDLISCCGIYVQEKGPREYDVKIALSLDGGNTSLLHKISGTEEFYLGIVQEYLQKMDRDKVGFCSLRTPLKVKVSGQKIKGRISKVIYVSSTPNTYRAENESRGQEINWSHRWNVRGHWRHVPGKLGKDRHGEYNVANYTWVSDHEKGPENAPKIKKTYAVI